MSSDALCQHGLRDCAGEPVDMVTVAVQNLVNLHKEGILLL